MKNLKKMAAAGNLMAVMVFGAVSANAKSLNSDKAADAAKDQCIVKNKDILQDLIGNIVSRLTGTTFFDAPTPVCTETDEPPTAGRVRWS